MEGRKTDQIYFNVIAPIIFFLIVLFLGAWGLFDGITKQGIDRGDSFGYLKEAKLWAEGQPPKFYRGSFYRPVSYFLQGIAIRVFGYNDYAVKLLHCSMGMISIVLIFLIASQLAGDYWVGLACGLIFTFLPTVVRYTKSELLHVESTFFVLWTLFFFILFARRETGTGKTGKRTRVTFLLLFLSGLCSGLAANTHPDLALLAPGYVLYLFISSFDSQNKKESLKKSLIRVSVFTFSFFTPYLLGFLLFGAERVLKVFSREFSMGKYTYNVAGGGDGKLNVFLGVFYHPLKFFFRGGYLFTGLFLAGPVAVAIYRRIIRKRDPLYAYLPLILIFSYALFYALFMNKYAKNRVLIPLLPMFIFFAFLWYQKIVKQLFRGFSPAVFVCLFLTLFLLNPKTLPGRSAFRGENRFIYDILKNDVDSKNKLLIAPVPMFYVCRGYQCDLYFGENAVYLIDLPLRGKYNPGSLNKLLKNRDIRYLFLGKFIHRNLLDPNRRYPGIEYYRRWLRSKKFHYSLEKDLDILHAYIRRRKGMLIHKNAFGKIYYLTAEGSEKDRNNLITNGSFEHWWKGFPVGEWSLINGRVSISGEATDGSYSMRLEPAGEKETRIKWTLPDTPGNLGEGTEAKLRTRLDVKTSGPGRFFFYFRAKFKKRWRKLDPGILWYTGKGEWVTFSEDIEPVKGMSHLTLDIWLRGGTEEPAFIDNISITPVGGE